MRATLPAGSTVYPPERNSRGQYLLWLSEAEAKRLSASVAKVTTALGDEVEGRAETSGNLYSPRRPKLAPAVKAAR